MTGKRIAIFGLGRSGLAIATAALAHSAIPHVFDQSSPSKLAKPEILEEAKALGIEVTMDWDGVLPTPGDGGLLVVNPAVDSRSPILKSAINQGYELLSEIEFAYRISKAPIIAITGTNGKSTTTVMTYLCLQHCGIDAVLCGNIFGSGYPEVPLTEAALEATEDQILVAEISSFQLEWISQFKPVSAGITNIWPDHLDRYDSFEEYAATKQRIFAAQDENGFAVIKAHDPVVKVPGASTRRGRSLIEASSVMHPPKVLSFGAIGEHAKIDERFLTVLDKQVKLEDLPFTEPHNFTNAAMAALLAYGALKSIATFRPSSKAGEIVRDAEAESLTKRNSRRNAYNARQVDSEANDPVLPACILEGIKEFHGIAHRMEFVGEKNGIRVINNSMCTNVDAVLKSATAVKGPNHILIGGRNKDLDFQPLKHYFANGMHHAYAYGEAREQVAEQIGTKLVYERMEDALHAALEKARSGEVVMLAPGCASTDQFRDFRHRGDVFKQLAKEWLES